MDNILSNLPNDLATARKHFHIDPEYIVYACCPSCFALHPPRDIELDNGATEADESALPPDLVGILPSHIPHPNSRPARSRAQYPEECIFRETQTSRPCGAKLLRNGAESRPIRAYSHQTFVSWLGRMLLRPDIERYLDASQANARANSSGFVEDILESSEVLRFLGPDGQPFLRQCGSEGRYLFSLFVDWFNPRGNKHGGSTYSAGVIFMVCLNLPPAIRYKRENIYLVGVMPGPKSPSLHQVNHFLNPLVRELNVSWSRGVYYSRTAYREQGRLTRCAALPLICDLGAGRKTSGQASHSAAMFCSFCQLLKSSINDLDRTSWPRRDCHAFRRCAEEWKEAPSERRREQLFKSSGIRYSSLLDLPYWRPTRYVVIDTMHNLFLGLFQRHCRRIFGMDVTAGSGDDLGDGHEVTPITVEEVLFARSKVASSTTATSLKRKLNLRLLRAIYAADGLGEPGTLSKQQLAQAILQVSRSNFQTCA